MMIFVDGACVSVGELLASARPGRVGFVLGLIANFVLLPAVTLGLLRLPCRPDDRDGIPHPRVLLPPLSGCRSRPSPVMSRSLGMMLIPAWVALLTPALLSLLLPLVAWRTTCADWPGDHPHPADQRCSLLALGLIYSALHGLVA